MAPLHVAGTRRLMPRHHATCPICRLVYRPDTLPPWTGYSGRSALGCPKGCAPVVPEPPRAAVPRPTRSGAQVGGTQRSRRAERERAVLDLCADQWRTGRALMQLTGIPWGTIAAVLSGLVGRGQLRPRLASRRPRAGGQTPREYRAVSRAKGDVVAGATNAPPMA